MAWLSGWCGIRVKITVDKDKIDSDLVDFPLPIEVTASDIFSEVGGSWQKIATTLGDEITQCYIEIKDWEDSSQKAHLFVKIPLLSSTVDTEIYLYADGTHTDNSQYVSLPGGSAAQQVYNSDFLGVWRLSQTPTNDILDSTSHNYNGTPVRMATGDLQDGQFGKCFEFRKTNYMSLPAGTANDSSSGFAVSGLAKVTDKTIASNQCIIGHTDDVNLRFEVGFWQTTGDYAVSAGGDHSHAEPSTEVSNDQWFHFAWVGENGAANLYINNVNAMSYTYNMVDEQYRGHTIGAWSHPGGGVFNFLAGHISDIQLYTVKLTDAWVKAEHAGYFGELISFGTREDAPAPPQYFTGSYQYAGRAKISYHMTLTGSTDIQLPISSFQLQIQEGQTRLSAVVPYSDDRAEQIAARSDGEMKVSMSFLGIETRELGWAYLEDIRIDEGGQNQNISLSGTRTATFANPDFVAIADPVYKNVSGGEVLYRFALPDMYLRPGDTLQADGDDILVTKISCSVSAQQQTMEVSGTYIWARE